VAVVTVDTVHPVQALIAESTEVQKAVSGPVVQKEARLTERFQQYLEGHDHKVMRYQITPAGTATLYSDLADITENALYEAKGSADRMSVRLALGQVLDYGRYIEGSWLAVLLPEAPAADLVALLEQHDVGCVVEATPENFIDMTALKRCP
jgi:altronate dehydratase